MTHTHCTAPAQVIAADYAGEIPLTLPVARQLVLIQAPRSGPEPRWLRLQSKQYQQRRGRGVHPTSAARRALPAGKWLQLGRLPVRQRSVSKTSM